MKNKLNNMGPGQTVSYTPQAANIPEPMKLICPAKLSVSGIVITSADAVVMDEDRVKVTFEKNGIQFVITSLEAEKERDIQRNEMYKSEEEYRRVIQYMENKNIQNTYANSIDASKKSRALNELLNKFYRGSKESK